MFALLLAKCLRTLRVWIWLIFDLNDMVIFQWWLTKEAFQLCQQDYLFHLYSKFIIKNTNVRNKYRSI